METFLWVLICVCLVGLMISGPLSLYSASKRNKERRDK